jgi:threonine/homoserine/homoserine lactone efflux protein
MDAFAFFAVAYLVAAGAPGTDTMLIVSRTIVGGWRSAVQYAIGIALAKTTMISLAFFGVAALVSANPQIFVILKALGAAFLLVLAVRLWLAKPQQREDSAETTKSKSASVLGGYLVGVSNPQPLMFYTSIVPIVVAQGLNTVADLFVLWAIVIGGFALITWFYVALAGLVKNWLDRSTNRIILNRVMALIFVIIALVIAFR